VPPFCLPFSKIPSIPLVRPGQIQGTQRGARLKSYLLQTLVLTFVTIVLAAAKNIQHFSWGSLIDCFGVSETLKALAKFFG
jgi:hypothetical protein